ncbi:50S ribosomal protein L25/general stress protein Ctc [Haliea sp. E1-2-M8]|uniref:50S ribosomal protein L25/general stress protein Ctc n=1 Tax=Haliea sp. E1-2-M8 TaxID=3064706 RepID=UPI00271ABCA3|nr:50S ribosomal protein L25/general stress protein Ctc [Haliea sp. E1-2-M8]MDO8861331.1 50S ribosomal protein L25/general stress protein Ctc [Haliea sp. E1-2-M8]
MSDQFELYAEVREDLGKGASRRLRRLADQVPAIIYGADKDPQPLSIIRKDLEKALEHEAFFSHVLVINIGGKKQKAILKDLQRHPARNSVTHADFLRVNEKVAIKVNVPVHFLNETTCHGVKVQGGMIQHQATDIEVLCLPSDIPEYLEVDMAGVEIGDIIHLSDIALPEGVVSVALSLGEDHDLAVASVVAPRGGSDDESEDDSSSSSDESSDSSED